MSIKTDALIIREYHVGEADRFVVALTRELGVIHASAKGARKIKSRNSTATSMLAYSHLALTESRDKYIVTEARPERLFYSSETDLTVLSLSQYFCELAGVLAPREEPAEDQLRLLLNALHLLTEGKKDPILTKAVVEWRLLTDAGYMPDLTGCCRCGSTIGPFAFHTTDGDLTCKQCGAKNSAVVISPTALDAMRYVQSAPIEKLFSFTVTQEACEQFAAVSEQFLLRQLNRTFKTLDFYRSLL